MEKKFKWMKGKITYERHEKMMKHVATQTAIQTRNATIEKHIEFLLNYRSNIIEKLYHKEKDIIAIAVIDAIIEEYQRELERLDD